MNGEKMKRQKASLVLFFCIAVLVGCSNEKTEKVPAPVLSKDMSTGVGIVPDYENESKIIFHGYFGLFVYDLVKEKITLAVDLKKLVGMNAIQGSSFVNVLVNDDGSKMMVYVEGNDTKPIEKKLVYYINSADGTYTQDTFKPFNALSYIVDGNKIKFEGSTLNDLTYSNGNKAWKVFEGWGFKKE